VVNRLIREARKSYYSRKIFECGRNQKQIYKISKQLLGESGSSPLPPSETPQELAESFSEFFTEKIFKIREALGNNQTDTAQPTVPEGVKPLSS
jgi:hypothetical protein